MSKKQNEAQSLSAKAWRKFRKNKLAWFGMGIIVLAILVSFLGANVRPDPTKDANHQISSLGTKEPGFEIDLLKVRSNKLVEETGFFGKLFFGYSETPYRDVPILEYRFENEFIYVKEYTEIQRRKDKETEYLLANVCYPMQDRKAYTVVGGQSIEFLDVSGDKITASIAEMQEEITSSHIEHRTYWLGTDYNGRDYLSRLMAGTSISLTVGFVSVLLSLIIGITLGALAGYYRGWVDDAVMYLINVVWSIPTILMVFAITMILGKGFYQIFIAVGLTMWVEVARIVRGQVMIEREKEFVEAGKALGYGHARIIWKHIIPNTLGPVIVISSANFAAAILIEAGLSFLGIGTQLPAPSWGNMVKDHFGFLDSDYSYLALIPGVCIIIMVLAIMLIGNALRDALDSRAVKGTGVGS